MIQNICILGSGNVGFHLGSVLTEQEVTVQQVWSRTYKKAALLAEKIGATPIKSISSLDAQADLYIIAVPDYAIASVAIQMEAALPGNRFVVHTSGATPSTILQPYFQQFGVFYPLQTFSITKKPNFQDIPICIDASSGELLGLLTELAQRISPKVFPIGDTQRAMLHVSAVFANNFTNYCYHIAAQILAEANIPFELLLPLIQETAEKVQYFLPVDVQTGPAIRGDQATMNRHLSLLSEHPDWAQLYQLLSEGIKQDVKP